jgi:hypothetical protein
LANKSEKERKPFLFELCVEKQDEYQKDKGEDYDGDE